MGLKILKFIFAFGVVPFVILGSLFWLNEKGFFNIDKIEITVENMVDQPQYLQPLVKKLDAIVEQERGISLWSLDLAKLNKKLNEFDWIQGINITRMWPSQLSVRVQVKEVKLVAVGHGGKLFPVVDQGQLLESVDAGEAPDVALLFGDAFEKKSELRKKAVDFVNELPREGAFSKKTISEIHYDEKEGFWLSLIKDNLKVKIGHDQISLKSARISQVIDYMESRQIDARVIDANLSKKVLVRLRKDP